MVESVREVGGVRSYERRCFLVSLDRNFGASRARVEATGASKTRFIGSWMSPSGKTTAVPDPAMPPKTSPHSGDWRSTYLRVPNSAFTGWLCFRNSS